MATLSEQLTEAKAVLHDWRLGKHARTYTDSNGEKIEYSVEGMRGLTAYIADLQRLVDIENGVSPGGRPMRVYF